MILAIETSCDDTCAAVVTARGGDPLERHLLAGRPRPLRRRRARGRRAPPPRARSTPSSTTRCARAGVDARRRRARRRHPGARAGRRAARRRRHGQGARRRARPAAGAGRPPPGPRRGELPRADVRSSRRSCAWSPAAATRSWRASRTTPASRSSAARSTTPPARRSTRARGCSACPYPGRPGARAPGARGRPGGLRLPDRRAASPGLDFSFAGLKTALLYKVRDLGDEAQAAPRRPRRLLPARDRRGARAARRARRCEQTGLDAPGDRRRRGRQRAAARAAGRARRRAPRARRARCAPTTRR